MRIILILLLVIVVAVVGGYFFLSSNLDSLVEAAIERGGSDATQSDVAVDKVEISFDEGSGKLTGLSVANPSGYSDDKALSLDGITLAIDPAKSDCGLSGCKLVYVKELTVLRPVLNYEVGVRRSNIDAIRENVQRYAGGGSSGGSGSGAGGSSTDSGMKFIVEKLSVTQGEIKVSTKLGKVASSDLPEVLKENLGLDEGGISGAEIGEVLIKELASNAKFVVNKGALSGLVDNPLPDDVGGDIKRGIGGLFGGDN